MLGEEEEEEANVWSSRRASDLRQSIFGRSGEEEERTKNKVSSFEGGGWGSHFTSLHTLSLLLAYLSL